VVQSNSSDQRRAYTGFTGFAVSTGVGVIAVFGRPSFLQDAKDKPAISTINNLTTDSCFLDNNISFNILMYGFLTG
jgi:hypothetical protein